MGMENSDIYLFSYWEKDEKSNIITGFSLIIPNDYVDVQILPILGNGQSLWAYPDAMSLACTYEVSTGSLSDCGGQGSVLKNCPVKGTSARGSFVHTTPLLQRRTGKLCRLTQVRYDTPLTSEVDLTGFTISMTIIVSFWATSCLGTSYLGVWKRMPQGSLEPLPIPSRRTPSPPHNQLSESLEQESKTLPHTRNMTQSPIDCEMWEWNQSCAVVRNFPGAYISSPVNMVSLLCLLSLATVRYDRQTYRSLSKNWNWKAPGLIFPS